MSLSELKKKSPPDLLTMASDMGIENISRARKQEVIFSLCWFLDTSIYLKSTISLLRVFLDLIKRICRWFNQLPFLSRTTLML